MIETTLVILMVTAMLIVHWIATAGLSASTLTTTGLLILALGMIEGIPTGLLYHIALHRALHRRGRLPAGWWISPTRYHVHLTEEENRRVRRWFLLGGLGFLFCVAGGILALTGMASGTL